MVEQREKKLKKMFYKNREKLEEEKRIRKRGDRVTKFAIDNKMTRVQETPAEVE